MSNFDDMNEQGIRNQLQDTVNSLAKDVNDYQMDLQDIVDHITATLPLLEYLCKTALNVSHLGHPKSMQELVSAAEDITLQHLGGSFLGEMQERHSTLEPIDEFEKSYIDEKQEAEKAFQAAYDKSVSDSQFEQMEEIEENKREFVPTSEYDEVGSDIGEDNTYSNAVYDESMIDETANEEAPVEEDDVALEDINDGQYGWKLESGMVNQSMETDEVDDNQTEKKGFFGKLFGNLFKSKEKETSPIVTEYDEKTELMDELTRNGSNSNIEMEEEDEIRDIDDEEAPVEEITEDDFVADETANEEDGSFEKTEDALLEKEISNESIDIPDAENGMSKKKAYDGSHKKKRGKNRNKNT